MSIRRVFVFTVCLLALRMGTAVGENIALKKPYVLKPRPSYPHCTDPGDARQLTDGKRLGAYWTQKTTVGWGRFETVFITIDLGKDHRIGGLSFSSAAGTAGVHWPAELLVFVSDDGKKWFQVGDLVKLSARKKAPPKKGYANHVFRTDGLDAYGRFVQVVAVPTEAYIFVDEVEVFSSDDSLPRKPRTGRGIDDLADFMSPQKRVFDTLIKAQLRRDLDAVRHDVKESTLTAKVDEAARAIEKMPKVSPKGFRAVLPMTDLERDIFRLQAEVVLEKGSAAVATCAEQW